MLHLIAQTAISTILGIALTDVFRAKPRPEPEPKVEGMKLENALRLAAVKRMAGVGLDDSLYQADPTLAAHTTLGSKRGHYVPPDARDAEESLRDLEAAINGFPASAGVTKGHTMNLFGSEYDIVGADLMFGADDSDILEALSVSGDGSSEIIGAELIGAVAKAASAGNPKARAALKQIAMRNAGAVIKNDLKNRRRYPLGFVPTEVDSGDAATIPAAPQNLFRPERLVIPSDIAFDFGVQDIKVGNQSQFAQSVEVPAAVFTEVSIDTNVTFDTAEVGNQISILVRNKGTEDDLEFTAAAIGTIAKS